MTPKKQLRTPQVLQFSDIRKIFEKDMSDLEKEKYPAGTKVKGMDFEGVYRNKTTEIRWWGYLAAAKDFGIDK